MNKFQYCFDDQFGFRAGNQNIGCDFEIEFEKLLVPGDVLERLALCAPSYEFFKLF